MQGKRGMIGLLTMVLLTISSHGGAGELDSSFGTDGKVMTAIGNRNDEANDVALQNDGKIVVVGYSNNDSRNDDFAIVRYNSDGSLDTSFDGDGKATTAIGNSNERALGIAIQVDGKIIATGYSYNSNNDDDFTIVRYNSDGSLDTTFDTDGIVTTDFGNYEAAYDITIQDDDKIVAVGFSGSGRSSDFAIARYNSNGSLDTTFGSDGKVTTTVGIGLAYATSVAIQNDGKIVVAGYSHNSSGYNDFAIVRYNTDGSLDTTFDGDGIVITAISSGDGQAYGVTIQDNGKIVVAGFSYNGDNNDYAVLRYNSDGSLDTTFDDDGIVTTAIGSHNDYATSVAIQNDGKIVAAGRSSNGSGIYDFSVVRYESNGSLDSSFGGGDGKVMTDLGSDYEGSQSITIQNDGKIVAAGHSFNGSNYDFAIVRYLGDLKFIPLTPIYYLLQ